MAEYNHGDRGTCLECGKPRGIGLVIKIRKSLLEFLQWRGDNWMVRALYLAQLLKEYGIDARPILKMDRKEIYPLLKEQEKDGFHN